MGPVAPCVLAATADCSFVRRRHCSFIDGILLVDGVCTLPQADVQTARQSKPNARMDLECSTKVHVCVRDGLRCLACPMAVDSSSGYIMDRRAGLGLHDKVIAWVQDPDSGDR